MSLRAWVLASLLLFGTGSTRATDIKADLEALQARVDQAAQDLDNDPRLAPLSRDQRRSLVQFVAGNMFFVLLHEMGHVHITEMGLPVLGREEDAADTFATVTMLDIGSAITHRMLVEAAKGWFLSARRDEVEGIKFAFYDDHGLDKQRAYWIVCLMVGSDPEAFKDLARETHLPPSQRAACVADYSNASWSWKKVLEPHRRVPDMPKTPISVTYGPDRDELHAYARSFRSIRLLETVAEHASSEWAWRASFGLTIQSCGYPGSYWDLPRRRVTLCYEMAEDFVQLYRKYADSRVLPRLDLK